MLCENRSQRLHKLHTEQFFQSGVSIIKEFKTSSCCGNETSLVLTLLSTVRSKCLSFLLHILNQVTS